MLRHRRRLDLALTPLVRRGWGETPDDTKDVLRIGAYQLLELARVPAYAAVETGVELAKRAVGAGAARLVNAVLRRIPDNPALVLPTTPAERYSHPDWLVERWTARWGETRTEALLAHNNTRPPLVIQPVAWTAERLAAQLGEAGVRHRPAPLGHGFVVERAVVTELPGYAAGAFVVQDPAQRFLLDAAGVPADRVVWDACAAPGGKAAHLAQRGRVLVSDIGQSRIPRLRDTLRRVAPDVPVVAADVRHPPFARGTVDIVVLDAPCSATGTMARHPDARWRLSPERIVEVARLQTELLDGAQTALGPRGRLVYLTCSLEPEENNEQVDRFMSHHPDFRRVRPDAFVFPPEAGTDGGFVAVLERA